MALTVGTLWASGWLVHRIGWPLRCGRLRSASALPAFVACGELVGLAQGERNVVEWKALGGSNGSDGRNAVGVKIAIAAHQRARTCERWMGSLQVAQAA